MANTHKKIQTVTVGAGGAASIDFTSIPQTYSDLKIVLSARDARAVVASSVVLQINGSSATSGSYRRIYGDGSAGFSDSSSGEATVQSGHSDGNSATANTFGNVEIYIPNYTGSSNKSFSSDGVAETNGATTYMSFVAGLWADTAAITSLSVKPATAVNFLQYTTATLYGVFNTNVSGAPSAPTSVTATGSELTASVAFTPAGQTASLYTVTSSPGSITATGTSSPIVVSGLTEGQAYTFTVTAANPLGTSAASSASNSITAATTIFYMTSSQTFTPPSYPFSYTAYVVGGGGTGGNNGTYNAGGNTTNVYLGSGGGSGFYTTGNGTINSGNATVTIGTGGSGGTIQGVGGAGGTSTFHNYNALGGNGGASSSDAGGTVNVPQSIGGGNGGSGGGGAAWYNINNKNGGDNSGSAVAGAGGSSGGAGGAGSSSAAGGSRPGGTGQGGSDSKIPSGAGGAGGSGGSTPNYAGITVSGSNTAYGAGDYANGRGMGGVNASAGTSGFVLVKRNA